MKEGSIAAECWKIINYVTIGCGKISAVLLLGIMFLSSADVILRYVAGNPIKGAYELNEILFLSAVLLSIAWTQMHRGHVNVDLLVSHLPKRAALALETCMLVIALFIYALMAWTGGREFLRSFMMGEYRWGLIPIPIWPARLMIPVGITLLFLRFVGDIVININTLVKPKGGE